PSPRARRSRLPALVGVTAPADAWRPHRRRDRTPSCCCPCSSSSSSAQSHSQCSSSQSRAGRSTVSAGRSPLVRSPVPLGLDPRTAMKRPTTGTVTFLFTDLEGSTGLAHRLSDRWSEVLVEHRRLIREPASSAGGHEIDCRGDELFVAFEDAAAAAQCAIDAQLAFADREWPGEEQVRVRIGMHTGEAIFADSDYLGLEV